MSHAKTLRKAAILISVLDRQNADALLDQMGSKQAAAVRNAVLDLGAVSAEERKQVIEEFIRVSPMVPQQQQTGIELSNLPADQFVSSDVQANKTESIQVDEQQPFRFLHEAKGELLAPFLLREHPQTIAVVLSHLPPERAADVLSRLPGQTQVEVVRRLIDLDSTDPEILQEIEDGLRSLLDDQLSSARRRSAGIAAVGAILKAAEQNDRKDILSNLADKDEDLAAKFSPREWLDTRRLQNNSTVSDSRPLQNDTTQEVRSNQKKKTLPSSMRESRTLLESESRKKIMIQNLLDNHLRQPAEEAISQDANHRPQYKNKDRTEMDKVIEFSDLVTMSDQDLASVIRHADPDIAILALTGAPNNFVERIMKLTPSSQAKILKKKIQQIGPIRLSDLEQAQHELALVATKLMAKNSIKTPTARGFAAAA